MADVEVGVLTKMAGWGFTIAIGLSVWAFRFVRAEATQANKDVSRDLADVDKRLNQHKEIVHARISRQEDRVHSRLEKQEQKILRAIKEIADKMTPIGHCNAKQELLTEKFNNLIQSHNTQQESFNLALSQVTESVAALHQHVVAGK